jgi:hypothetical protein
LLERRPSADTDTDTDGKPDKTEGTKAVVTTKRKPLPMVIEIYYEVAPRESTQRLSAPDQIHVRSLCGPDVS